MLRRFSVEIGVREERKIYRWEGRAGQLLQMVTQHRLTRRKKRRREGKETLGPKKRGKGR